MSPGHGRERPGDVCTRPMGPAALARSRKSGIPDQVRDDAMGTGDSRISGCMGLFAQIDRGVLSIQVIDPRGLAQGLPGAIPTWIKHDCCTEHRDPAVESGVVARAVFEPDGAIGVLHHHRGDPDVTGDVLHPSGEGAMLPGIEIAARRTAPLAAVHAAARPPVDGRRATGRAGAGLRAAARGIGKNCGLAGGRPGLHVRAPKRPGRLAE